MRGAWASLAALALATALATTAGCDLDRLRSSELFGNRDGAVDAQDASLDAPPETNDSAPADVVSDVGVDVVADTAADSVGNPDAPTGMLSGSVTAPCGAGGVDALVGIAGRHTCSFAGKGSYFFPRLPLGLLKLAAMKEGYVLYEANIEIVAGGNIHNIQLVPAADGGCGAPPPQVACTCTASTCD